MRYSVLSLSTLICFLHILAPTVAKAEGCPARAAVSLFHSCEILADVEVDFLPLDFDEESDAFLTVTGAYSSGDRFGVEGLAIGQGNIVSKRFQGWDGLLVVSKNGDPQIFQTENVVVDGQSFNLKKQPDRANFIDLSQKNDMSVIQSHLLIANGALDLSDVENAPRFVRRMFFQDAGGWGLYETKTALTLYEAAIQIQQDLNPSMVLNLDMGAYNYCEWRDGENTQDCGDLFVGHDKLTNVIRLKQSKTN